MTDKSVPGLFDVPGRDFTPNRRDRDPSRGKLSDVPNQGVSQIQNYGNTKNASATRTISPLAPTPKPTRGRPSTPVQPGDRSPA